MSRAGRILVGVRRRPRRVDAVVAVLLAGLLLEEIFLSDVTGPVALLVPTALAITLPLAWRRTAPVAVAGMAAAAYAAQRIFGDDGQEPQSPFIPLLLATFSVGAYASRRASIAGLLAMWAGLLAAEPGDFIVMGPVFTGTWLAGRLVRSRERDAKRLGELSVALERERVEEARIAAAEERARIARELHDVIAHSMSTIVLEAGAERVNLPEDQRSTRDTLRSIERTGREALTEMRRLVGILREEGDDAALAPQPKLAHLDELVERVRRAGLPVTVEVLGSPQELTPGLDISAYRIVQEALTNVLKHAGDARATVVLTYAPESIEVEVSDDGRGGTANGSGHGLAGLRERVAVFGGRLDAGSPNGGGFVVRARLPVERSAA